MAYGVTQKMDFMIIGQEIFNWKTHSLNLYIPCHAEHLQIQNRLVALYFGLYKCRYINLLCILTTINSSSANSNGMEKCHLLHFFATRLWEWTLGVLPQIALIFTNNNQLSRVANYLNCQTLTTRTVLDRIGIFTLLTNHDTSFVLLPISFLSATYTLHWNEFGLSLWSLLFHSVSTIVCSICHLAL